MNILKELMFNAEKPAILPVKKTDKLNIFAIGLKEEQEVSKHKTANPTLLMVTQGKIRFSINNESFDLYEHDTYQIPEHVEHELKGLEYTNIVLLIQEKNGN